MVPIGPSGPVGPTGPGGADGTDGTNSTDGSGNGIIVLPGIDLPGGNLPGLPGVPLPATPTPTLPSVPGTPSVPSVPSVPGTGSGSGGSSSQTPFVDVRANTTSADVASGSVQSPPNNGRVLIRSDQLSRLLTVDVPLNLGR